MGFSFFVATDFYSGGDWELRLWFAIERAQEAVAALRDCPAFARYWEVSDGCPGLFEPVERILEQLGTFEEGGEAVFLGRTDPHDLPVWCHLQGRETRGDRDEAPAPFWKSLWMRFSIPDGCFEERFEKACRESAQAVVFPVLRGIAHAILSRAAADIGLYCWEDYPDFDDQPITSGYLHDPAFGVILRKDHPRAAEPGGIAFLPDYVLFEAMAATGR